MSSRALNLSTTQFANLRHLHRPTVSALWQLQRLPNATASSSSSRLLSTYNSSRQPRQSQQTQQSNVPTCMINYRGKGKQRWDTPYVPDRRHLSAGPTRRAVLRNPKHVETLGILGLRRNHPFTLLRGMNGDTNGGQAIRRFHATPRHEALLPVLPAALGAFFKGTTMLGVATGLSRVLISFMPLGWLATFRFARGVTWFNNDVPLPKASPDADEFWKMWCQDEKPVTVTSEDAEQMITAPGLGEKSVVLPDGRIAYTIPLPSRWRSDFPKPENETDPAAYAKWVRQMKFRIRHNYFFLPPLPAISVKYYNELSSSERKEVDSLRWYWTALRMFKDRLKMSRFAVAAILGIPILLLFAVYIAGMERVPLTGRWRVILLTPEEEDTISNSLEGANWFKSVINLLTTPEHPAPPILPLTDWRWAWVNSTLRRLETGVISEVERLSAGGTQPSFDHVGVSPPPSRYPIRPRPRVSARLHAALSDDEPEGEYSAPGMEHLELGPPYNIMILDAPDKNAFSYGFGGNGAGGIVIFTGLLDEILAHGAAPPQEPPTPPPSPPPSRGIFGGLFAAPPPLPVAVVPQPTEEQTLYLAIVLAHEMGHLLLSHHLETLSHQQVLWPSVVGLSVDLIRSFIWPFTFFLGPTVNDALANVGRTSTEELTQRYGHIGFEYKHEYEADLTALRLLSHAGYDPAAAVKDFAESITEIAEIEKEELPWWSLFKLWSVSGHPKPEERVKAMEAELQRWYDVEAKERAKADKAAAKEQAKADKAAAKERAAKDAAEAKAVTAVAREAAKVKRA